jgi:MFS family permease
MEFSDTQLALLGTTRSSSSTPVWEFHSGEWRTAVPVRRLSRPVLSFGVCSRTDSVCERILALFFCRVMVGVGEATLGPARSPSFGLLPAVKRATVTSIYSMGIAIGAGLAALLGGSLSQFGWRTAFLVVGFPGVLMGMLVFFLNEPARQSAAALTRIHVHGLETLTHQ